MSFVTTSQALYFKRLLLPLVLISTLLLSGCVNLTSEVNFEGTHRGAIVQQIKLGEQLTSFNQSEAENWLNSIERRARKLQGKTKRVSPQEIIVTIPFNNGAELESKFNQFFNPNPQQKSRAKRDELDLVQLSSKLHLNQSNLLLLQRDRLSLDLDLRSLGVLSTENNIVISPDSLFDLKFVLNTPWGARSVERTANSVSPEVRHRGNQIVWKLQPGQINHIEAVFWLPSPLGLGTVAIAFLVVIGFYLKYKRFPWKAEPITPSTLSEAN